MPSTSPVPVGYERPHFLGIGGSGMSGIAKLLQERGARVTGSDRTATPVTEALRELGSQVYIGHDAGQLPTDASCVVVSSAIAPDNPELLRAKRLGLALVPRAQALAELMAGHDTIAISGTHGKTTTTSLLAAAVCSMGGQDPTYAIGADQDMPLSSTHQGGGRLFLAEADESDRSFTAYTPEVAVVLNIEHEHHATYPTLDDLIEAFDAFARRLTTTGTLVLNADDPHASELRRRLTAAGNGPRILTFGASPGSDIQLESVERSGTGSRIRVRIDSRHLDFNVSVPGQHYALDAVAALTAGVAYGFDPCELAPHLASYTGAKRRLEPKGTAAGVQVLDTYAHHPTEMAADLAALREAHDGSRLLVIYQPHLYSRTQALGIEMGQALALADACVVLDVYPAREEPIPGITSHLIVDAARKAGADVDPQVRTMATGPAAIAALARPGDVLVTMGGGDITLLGPRILHELSTTAAVNAAR